MSAARAMAAAQARPLAQAISAAMKAAHMSRLDFIKKTGVGGEKFDGQMAGKIVPMPKTLARYEAALDLPPGTLLVLRPGDAPPAPAAVPAVYRPDQRAVAPKLPDQFSLTIDMQGRATLRVNLIDVPMQVALRAMHSLTSSGLLSPEAAE